MKKVYFFFLLLTKWAQAQPTYFQQQVNYQLQVQLNDVQHRLTGHETIQYTNRSQDTLTYIWFHLWPNAYKNDRTAFSEQLLNNNRIDYYFSADSAKGYISQLNFTVNGNKAILEPHATHIDIAKLLLPQPLLPNQTVTLATPFEVQLPHNFSRGGHIGQFYQITQWYPKPAVYDNKGWHAMPYLDQGEFYSEFGSYDVQITLPANYLVASSGRLQNADLLQQLKTLGKQPINQQPNALWYQAQMSQRNTTPKGKHVAIKPRGPIVPPSASAQQTWHFTIDSAHDVAWFASKKFVIQYDTVSNTNQTPTDVFTYFHPWQSKQWGKAVQFAKNALSFYSRQLGPYPYHTASVVAGNEAIGSGGMEYPSITLITTQSDSRELDATIAHELGHNWFYAALASNERDHAWMDESMNTFYQEKYEQEQYLTQSFNQPSKANKSFEERKGLDQLESTLVATLEKMHKAQPINLPSATYTDANYGLMVYAKGSQWMQRLEQYLGKTQFEKSMQQYYQQWRFKHPYPLDFKKSIEQSSGKSIDSLFHQLGTTTALTPILQRKWKPTGFFSLYQTNKYKYLSLMPIVGTNANDKLMLGLLVHNYQLPLPNWQFTAAPLWASGSKQLNGFARMAYQKFLPSSSLVISGSVIKYNYQSFTPNDAPKLYLGVTRWVPSVKYTWYNKDLRNKAKCELLLRSVLLNETALRFSTINISPTETKQLVTTEPAKSYINQLLVTWSNSRKLYPYSLQLGIDQGSKFLRAGVIGNYFFNYPSQIGGIETRFFAGKFVYLSPQTYVTQSQTYRYHLQLSAPNGASDYTHSQYFIGRGDFEGWRSQQVMQRDGFFKVNTLLSASQIGRTDDWLMAFNVSGNIPNKYNPLSVLPIKLPLKFFVDAGTYAEAWQDNAASGRFLYDAGLQVSLMQNLINIYFPIVSSKVFTDYQKSILGKNRFWKTVSFSIDIQRLKPSFFSKYIPL